MTELDTKLSFVRVLGVSNRIYVFFITSFFVMAFLETLSVGIIPIFIGGLADPEMIRKLPYVGLLMPTTSNPSEHFASFGLVLVGLFIFKNSLLMLLGYKQASHIVDAQARLASRLLSSYLYRPYVFHLQRNSAELVRNTSGLAFSIFSGYVIPSCTLVTETLVIVMVAGLLLVTNPLPTLFAGLFLVVVMFAFYRIFKPKIGLLGEVQQHHATGLLKSISQALWGVKESKVLGREPFFIDLFNQHVYEYAKTSIFLQVIQQVPKYIVETITVIGLVSMVLILMKQGNSHSDILMVLSLFGVAALRMMPSVNRILNSLTMMRANECSLKIISDDLAGMEAYFTNTKRERNQRVLLRQSININGLSFHYPGAATPALDDVNLSIRKGEMVAFVGHSGAGKSTLADVILGLFEPTVGTVTVDGFDISQDLPNWQANIGYVPQNGFISDDSIRRNVAFGVSDHEIDDGKVEVALRKAQLQDFVVTLADGLDTVIGERGGRLSGGQRQRISIARALYHDPEVLVMDEATSALDNRTEREISAVLQDLAGQKTIIVIAHRLSTIKQCDKLFLFQDGKMIASGSYTDLASNNVEFQSLTDINQNE